MKAYTDIPQSIELAKYLPLESSDMGYLWNGTSFCEYPVSNQTIFKRVENLPCWSLSALLDALPNENMLVKTTDGEYYCLAKDVMTKHHDNPIDACVEMIIKLKERNLL